MKNQQISKGKAHKNVEKKTRNDNTTLIKVSFWDKELNTSVVYLFEASAKSYFALFTCYGKKWKIVLDRALLEKKIKVQNHGNKKKGKKKMKF